MTAKEHTETISLVKSTSPFDGLDIQYVEWHNKSDLTIHLKFMLNDRPIGVIRNIMTSYHPFVFKSDTPLLRNTEATTLPALQKQLESKLEELFTYLNTLK